MKEETIDGFIRLFRGRSDAYFDSATKTCRREPLTREHFKNHLNNPSGGMGIYPVSHRGSVAWGCFDFDLGGMSSRIASRALQSCAVHLRNTRGLEFALWTEPSRSKGEHVWLFTEPAPAQLVQDALRSLDHIAGTECDEINPKGTDPKALVNCVRLPYAGEANPGRMVVLDDNEQPLTVEDFVERASKTVCSIEDLRRITRLTPRLFVDFASVPTVGANGRQLLRPSSSSQPAAKVYRGEETIPIGRRDESLFAVAKYMHGCGLPQVRAMERMTEIHANQVEHGDDPYPLDEALKKVRRAYG